MNDLMNKIIRIAIKTHEKQELENKEDIISSKFYNEKAFKDNLKLISSVLSIIKNEKK